MGGAVYEIPLEIYVVWAPRLNSSRVDETEAATIAQKLYCLYCRDVAEPLTRGIGIPTYFRSVRAKGSAGPLPIEFRAQRTLVVVLVTAEMPLNGEVWAPYFTAMLGRRDDAVNEGRQVVVLPVALDSSALSYRGFPGLNMIRLDFAPSDRMTTLLVSVTHELARLLEHSSGPAPGAPVNLFISHAKQGGVDAAIGLKEAIEKTQMGRFFDAVSITPGFRFDDSIIEAINESLVVILLTDKYSTRPWCRREAIEAKRKHRPMLVVDALVHEDLRSFPYLGNVRVLRWKSDFITKAPNEPSAGGDVFTVILAALLEQVKFSYYRRRAAELKRLDRFEDQSKVLYRAPEVLDCSEWRECTGSVVYPDPPLGPEEVKALGDFCPDVKFKTYSMPREAAKLNGMRIGISISDSPDLQQLGLAETHLRDVMYEVARSFLTANAKLGYGGDLRSAGFTWNLLNLIASHYPDGFDSAVLKNFEAWMVHKSIPSLEMAEIMNLIEVERVELPDEVKNEYPAEVAAGPDRDTALGRYIMARSLTAMREVMQRQIQARVLMGGKVAGYSGRMPGLLEEFVLAAEAQIPIYIVGGFGGCAGEMVEILEGKPATKLTEEWQIVDPNYREVFAMYAENEHPVRYSELVNRLKPQVLGNGLDPSENLRLMKSADSDEICYLIHLGLSRKA